MIIYFYSPHKFISKKLAEPLEFENHICHNYSDLNAFYVAIENLKNPPDLLVLDYTTFNHNIFNVYRYMIEFNKLIPLIFYNDPIPKTKSERINSWIMIFNSYYFNHEKFNLENYKNIFENIASTIENKNVKPYIPLLQNPLPPPEENEVSNTPDAALKKARLVLTPTLYNIFLVLFQNKEKFIDLSKLQALLKNKGVEQKENSIYSSICRLRERLSNFSEINCEIIKTRSGYKLSVK